MVEFAREGMVPERVETFVLDMDVDLCLMEEDVDFSVRENDLIEECKLKRFVTIRTSL